jgi:hypothetical protein
MIEDHTKAVTADKKTARDSLISEGFIRKMEILPRNTAAVRKRPRNW